MNPSDVAEVEELSETGIPHHADRAGISTSGFSSVFQYFQGVGL